MPLLTPAKNFRLRKQKLSSSFQQFSGFERVFAGILIKTFARVRFDISLRLAHHCTVPLRVRAKFSEQRAHDVRACFRINRCCWAELRARMLRSKAAYMFSALLIFP